jgi:predicted metalloprotease with PDZ domain
MRGLYRDYYQQKKRGFTDAEFRAACEKAAGGPLDEVFSYASTSKEMDYARYFAYAGQRVEMTSEEAPGTYLGVNTQTQDDGLSITDVDAGSPAAKAGLAAHDRIATLDGAKATPVSLKDLLAAKKPGDTTKVQFARGAATQDVEIVLGKNSKRTYKIVPIDNVTPLQAAILKDWMR